MTFHHRNDPKPPAVDPQPAPAKRLPRLDLVALAISLAALVVAVLR